MAITFNVFTISPENISNGYTGKNTIVQENKNSIQFLRKCENQLNNIDNMIDNLDNTNVEILTMIVNQQKQVVLAMLGQNSEQAISSILAGSIEIYAQHLQKIYGWTQGGVEMFRSSLMVMFENIKKDGVDSIELEDLFQLALLEIMVNAEAYGLEGWYNENKEHISHVLESIGSASHSVHEPAYDSPEKMAKWCSQLYEGLKKEGNIPADSFLGLIMGELDKKGGSKALSDQIINGWDDDYGWWIHAPEKGDDTIKNRAENISPMLRLFILSSLLNEKEMNKEQVDLILTGSLADIDNFIASEFEVEEHSHKYESATLSWLVATSDWQVQEEQWGVIVWQLDWDGEGISLEDLNKLYKGFPSREISEDELEEINRIGDQVKMLQQTLKYWTQLCTDERLAMARNI